MNMRKSNLILGILLLLAPFYRIAAQGNEEGNERIRAEKVAFITQKLSLTPQEAQVFWPVYNEYDKKRNNILIERRNALVYFNQNEAKLTDKETNEMINRMVKLQQDEANLLTDYNAQFLKILPPRKVMKLYIAEVEFKNFLLRQIRDNKTAVRPPK